MSSFKLNPRFSHEITPFYDEFLAPGLCHPLYCLTNFSNHPITDPHTGMVFPTAEHYFQAHKIWRNPKYTAAQQQRFLDELRRNPSPRHALDTAGLWTGKPGAVGVRPADFLPWTKAELDNWENQKEEIMSATLDLKLNQHPDVARALSETGNTCLVEDTYSSDDIEWGWGATGAGKNLLGLHWMRKRNRLHMRAGRTNLVVASPLALYRQVQAERLPLGRKTQSMEKYATPVGAAALGAGAPAVATPALRTPASRVTPASLGTPASPSLTPTPAPSSPFGGLFSGLSSMGSGFADGLKNAGKAFFNMFKELADGTIKIEPLDIYTAIGDLIKSFFNAIFECCVKPAASALGITDPSIVGDSVGDSTASPSHISAAGAGASKSTRHMPGDIKRDVERSSIAGDASAEHASKGSKSRKSSKGLGFSSGSADAGLHGHGVSTRSKVARSAFDYDCHDELYDPDTSDAEVQVSPRATRRATRRSRVR